MEIAREKYDSYRTSHSQQGYGKNYDSHFKGSHMNAAIWGLEKQILEEIFNNISKNRQSLSYLDFACGTGRLTKFFEDKVEKSTGIDITEEMTKVAQTECSKTSFIVADITKDEFKLDEKYDLITAFRFFLNAEQELREKAMEKLAKMLDRDGFFVFNIHGNRNSFRHLAIRISQLFGRKTNTNEMSIKELETLLNKNGLKIISYHGVNFLPQFTFRIFPKSVWLGMERMLGRIKFLDKFAINIIFVVKHHD